jgi:hypothetical protein
LTRTPRSREAQLRVVSVNESARETRRDKLRLVRFQGHLSVRATRTPWVTCSTGDCGRITISRLRRKLGDPPVIETIAQACYRMLRVPRFVSPALTQ